MCHFFFFFDFEIGRLPMEWAKCVIPLVNGTKVKLLGRCVAAPSNLSMMQEIMLYIRLSSNFCPLNAVLY